MKKITLQLRSKEQAVEIIERTLSELLQTFDTTQKDSGRRYIKIILSKDQSIIIKMLNHYYAEQGYVLCVYSILKNDPPSPILSSIVNDMTKDGAIRNLSSIITEFAYHYKTSSIIIEYCLNENIKVGFRTRDVTDCDNCNIIDYIFEVMNKYNDCMILRLDYLINIGCPEEVTCEYNMKIQYTEVFGQDFYSLDIINLTGDTEEFINLNPEDTEATINDTLNIMRKIASTAILEKQEKGKILMLELVEECYNV